MMFEVDNVALENSYFLFPNLAILTMSWSFVHVRIALIIYACLMTFQISLIVPSLAICYNYSGMFSAGIF